MDSQQHCKQKKEGVSATASGVTNSITIVGFLLFLSGVTLFAIGIIDVLVQIDSVKTAALIVGGLLSYKVGHIMIRHCATLKVRPERRRLLLSDNS
ncbi:hypothetical protein KO518_00745 [Aestuariibacter sp. A3R04]|nr:hypothetical protein [Aestuariibacter sp. A3R04]MBU3020327.1 hypothetical protein [Aestuariibacter sp. A3R04]